ncbi:DUF2189 domain-containing protein [Actibacterium sp. XHP0104]|uniref:DUF2189 domain-containing protein n=1 Tax=Actibacterium sp. XHP0104 TaxID=2984335 RepID=UPI0021E8F633|nr:DUF2189 domain-containing protein [Actibacterium sp. XHP0104]MCV2881931.1 DUF2189 domain-containing protein [Actibacterium sp. XHP0104]
MVNTIGNPLTWGAQAARQTGHHLADATAHVQSSRSDSAPIVNKIGLEDLSHALRMGVKDFAAFRSDVMFLVILYPIIGMVMAWVAFNANLAPYMFPLASGFALLGPVAGIFLYELSRRREMGMHATWGDAFGVLRGPQVGPIIVLGMYLLGMFLTWMIAAHAIFTATMGPDLPTSTMGFFREVFSTEGGAALIIIGIPVGAVFAAIVLAISVVSFPLLMDRDVGLPVAVATSLRVTAKNPLVIGAWGLIVAAALAIGSLPMFLGLVIVMPILGHATWHLYRRAVS